MTTCPKCHTQVTDTTNFCPECGEELAKATSNSAWIAAMQERIKEARHKRSVSKTNSILGIFVAVGIGGAIFSSSAGISGTLVIVLWICGISGVLICIVSIVRQSSHDDNVKKLTDQLAKGKK